MTWLEAFRIAFDSISAHKLRSFLTLLGVIIGVAVVTAVATVIEGANAYVSEKIASLGSGVFQVQKASVQGFGDFQKFLEALRKNPDLKYEDLLALRQKVRSADEIAAVDIRVTTAKYASTEVEGVLLQGVTPNLGQVRSLDVASGRFLTSFDDENKRQVVFIGAEVAKGLFGGVDPVGKEIKLGADRYAVAGVAKALGSVLGFSQDNFVMIPLSVYLKTFGSRRSLTFVVHTREGLPRASAEDEVRTVLRTRHALKYEQPDDFSFVTDESTEALFGTLTTLVASVALPITGISLVVGGIVIMNIMLVSVTERTKEIGIRKSLGARSRDILLQFLIESVILSATGGLFGLLVAYAGMKIASGIWSVPVALPVWAVAIALMVSSSVGLFFGIYPANRAAKLDPIEALRSE